MGPSTYLSARTNTLGGGRDSRTPVPSNAAPAAACPKVAATGTTVDRFVPTLFDRVP